MNDPQSSPFEPPPPPPRWKLRIGVSLVTAAALVWGGLEAYDYTFVRCADGVRERGPNDECVGISTDGFHFNDRLAEVVRDRIHRENERVESTGKPWVGIVYAEPMTLGTGDKGWESIQQELQGAYLAQRELNQASGGHGDTPLIKLLPANTGHGSGQWRPVVEQITGMTDDENPVVAVAGFGQSLGTTQAAVDALRKEGVPMVGSTVTADGLSDREHLTFFRAVSPNADQSRAVAKYLAARQQAGKGSRFRVQVVRDINPDDMYSSSLRKGFYGAAGDVGLELDDTRLRFISKSEGVGNALASVAEKVCTDTDEQPDAVYFAGRGRDLKVFIESAAAVGHCPVEVYTGDDAVGMYFDIPQDEKPQERETFRNRWAAGGVTVRYTALAHPDAAADIYKDRGSNPFETFENGYVGTFGKPRGLLNGQAMLGHDATLLAGIAIRKAAGPQGHGPVSPESVNSMLVQLSGRDAMDGVSGPIDFDDYGNPHEKPLPLVQLEPEGLEEFRYLEVLRP